MKYYFIANNPKNSKFLATKLFDTHDVIIVFNHSPFENHPAIRTQNKYHFFRWNGTTYWGIKTHCNCNKVFVGIGRSNKNKTIYNVNEMFMEKYNYSKNKKTPQTGSIAFEYFKENMFNNDDQIFLVGFTSIYDRGLWNGHSKELEDNYFAIQAKNYNVSYINDHL